MMPFCSFSAKVLPVLIVWAFYGIVDGIQIDISDTATLNDGNSGLIHLWQRNCFAVRAEIEASFVVADDDAFFQIAAEGATGETA